MSEASSTNYQTQTGDRNTNFFGGEHTHVYSPEPPQPGALRQFNVPYDRNPFFVGREQILADLHEALSGTGAAALSQAIAGLGGIGKTQTAVEYAYRYAQVERVYEWVFWVKAETAGSLGQDFGEIARLVGVPGAAGLKLEERVGAARAWLNQHGGWLLIFDNADDPALLKGYRPTNPQGRVLLTSRAQSFGVVGIGKALTLAKLEPEEAERFLWERTGREALTPSLSPQGEGSRIHSLSPQGEGSRIQSPSPQGEGSRIQSPSPLGKEMGREGFRVRAAEREAVAALARELDYLPLALEQAAAYIAAKQVSFGAYGTSYGRRRLALLEQQRPETGDYPASVATTWLLNFEAVRGASLASAQVLELSGFLAADGIPDELLVLGRQELGEEIAAALAEVEEDPVLLAELLEPLARYSLIRLEPEQSAYSIHRMVQAVVRDRLTVEARGAWVERLVAAVWEAFPPVEFEHWERCRRLVEHGEALAEWEPEESVGWGKLLNEIGGYFNEQAEYERALRTWQRSLSIREAQLGADHPDTAQSLNNLAELYRSTGRYGEAEPLFQRSLSIREAQLGADHPSTAQSLSNLAGLYKSTGRYGEAEPLYRRSLSIREAQLGADHPSTATSLNNLAELYRSMGRYGEAEPLYQRSLAIREAQLGADHPSTATSLNNLALLYHSTGRYGEAEPLYQRSLAIREAQLGAEHPDTATSLNNLAGLYESTGRYGEAEPLWRRSLSIIEAQLGADHPTTAGSLNNLAGLYQSMGRYGEAEPLYRRSLAIHEAQLGADHPSTATSLNNLAGLYRSTGRYGEAEPLYVRTVQILLATLGQDHPNTQTVIRNFVYLIQQVIKANRTAELSDHPMTRAILESLKSEEGRKSEE